MEVIERHKAPLAISDASTKQIHPSKSLHAVPLEIGVRTPSVPPPPLIQAAS